MYKKIGKVVLDYRFYSGSDQYTDGIIEDDILECFQENRSEQLLKNSNQWPILYHISDIRENLLDWYPFKKDGSLMEIGSGCGALTRLFSSRVKEVTCIELSEKRSLINAERNKDKDNIKIILGNFQDITLEEKFDYITMIGVWEYAELYVSGEEPYVSMINKIKDYLKPEGRIIVAIENKMGMKYFNGAVEDHTAKMYSGLNDYVGGKGVRTFSKPEIEKILNKTGIENRVFYYPLSDYKIPDVIYSDVILPQVGNIRYYKKEYSDCRLYNFYDATAYDQVCKDGMFGYFANSFLFICGEKVPQVLFAKYNRMRRKEYRIKTEIVNKAGTVKVIKTALNKDACAHIISLKHKENAWRGVLPSIDCVYGENVNECYETQYAEGLTVEASLYEYRHSARQFINVIKNIIDKYLIPPECIRVPFGITEKFAGIFGTKEPLEAYSLRVTNVDMIFSNLKLEKDKLVNFDFEWVFDFPIPYEYVLWRAAYQLYDKYAVYLKPQISKEKFLAEVGVNLENISIYKYMEKKFGEYVCGEKGCEKYLNNYEKSVCMQSFQFR